VSEVKKMRMEEESTTTIATKRTRADRESRPSSSKYYCSSYYMKILNFIGVK
jgi:hypothetical protein